MPAKSSASPRQRLLEAANKLFYEEGVHSVGIDRVIEKAGVAKASLYSSFGSKDELIHEYLTARFERRRKRIEAALEAHDSARERILAVFDVLAQIASEPGFRGCAFLRASAEGHPTKKLRAVCAESRAWLKNLFVELSAQAGVTDPEPLARMLVLLYDGAGVAAQMDGDSSAARSARGAAAALLDSALPACSTHSSGAATLSAP